MKLGQLNWNQALIWNLEKVGCVWEYEKKGWWVLKEIRKRLGFCEVCIIYEWDIFIFMCLFLIRACFFLWSNFEDVWEGIFLVFEVVYTWHYYNEPCQQMFMLVFWNFAPLKIWSLLFGDTLTSTFFLDQFFISF